MACATLSIHSTKLLCSAEVNHFVNAKIQPAFKLNPWFITSAGLWGLDSPSRARQSLKIPVKPGTGRLYPTDSRSCQSDHSSQHYSVLERHRPGSEPRGKFLTLPVF